jgi:hypothetical protein
MVEELALARWAGRRCEAPLVRQTDRLPWIMRRHGFSYRGWAMVGVGAMRMDFAFHRPIYTVERYAPGFLFFIFIFYLFYFIFFFFCYPN